MKISHNYQIAYLRDRRFTCYWKLPRSEMFRRVVWYKSTDVSEKHIASIFRIEQSSILKHISPKCLYISARIHGVAFKKTLVCLVEVRSILWNRMTSPFFWDVAPRRWVIGAQRFETACKFRLKMSKWSHVIKDHQVTHQPHRRRTDISTAPLRKLT